ncbi:MAG TPA: hypothetical protein VLV87_04750, partial [Gammaproteobacteria bacterium]|nr:hypothetical protein [Gammaproteobacteria bacterium]
MSAASMPGVSVSRQRWIVLCLLTVMASGAFAASTKHKPAYAKAAVIKVVPAKVATKAAPAAATVAAPKPATVAAPAAATDPNLVALQMVSGMAEAGAPHLALQIMDRDQPGTAGVPADWMAWERERIFIYQQSHAWKSVIARVDQLPRDATPDLRAWETMQAADAWLHLGDGAKALALVQPLVWSGVDDRTLADLRQLVIRSYTAMGKLDDALTAVIR